MLLSAVIGEEMSASLAGMTTVAFGLQVLLLGTLVAITIFRKEMSCNRCYAAEQEQDEVIRCRSNGSRSSPSIRSRAESSSSSGSGVSATSATNDGVSDDQHSWDERRAESLLEGAGCYYSSRGTYNLLLSMTQQILCAFPPIAIVVCAWESISSWWVIAAQDQRFDEVLDGAEHWCVRGPPLAAPRQSSACPKRTSAEDAARGLFPQAPDLPSDSLVHILSFLHPKDVVSFASTSKLVHIAIDNESNECSVAVWKALWYRDYSWLVSAWDVGREAAKRSLSHVEDSNDSLLSLLGRVAFSKEFYFRFGVSYLDYVIAGQCSTQRCLVGLGGSIYDLTSFLEEHPGSPETVMVHAGRDASAAFESIRHTTAARTMGALYCIVVDTTSDQSNVGVRPTATLTTQLDACTHEPSVAEVVVPAPVKRRQPNGCSSWTGPSTLELLRLDFAAEKEKARERARRKMSPDAVLGEAHAYYDPFRGTWRAWYIDASMQAAFVDI